MVIFLKSFGENKNNGDLLLLLNLVNFQVGNQLVIVKIHVRFDWLIVDQKGKSFTSA
jgi:hypothetical protein